MKIIFILGLLFNFHLIYAQSALIDTVEVRKEFENMMTHIEKNYVYFASKDVDVECLKNHYLNKIKYLKNKEDVLLFFEYFIDEFYDSHFHLNTNINSSYRLSCPIYVSIINGKTIITSVWKSQIKKGIEGVNLIGSEIIKFNKVDFNKAIENFPTHCQNKNNIEVRSWLSNKILAGKYNEPRILTIKTKQGQLISFNIDDVEIRQEKELLSYYIKDSIGVIRINNSLGDFRLKRKFKKAIKALKNTKGLIVDLRNTVDGGSTGVAYPLVGHFSNKKVDFQSYKNSTTQFTDYVKPKNPHYSNPIILLVGRWTGSMGEGMAIGFDASNMAEIIGTKMQGLAGATHFKRFKYLSYGYQFSYIDIFHLNGTSRLNFEPKIILKQSNSKTDKLMEKAFLILK